MSKLMLWLVERTQHSEKSLPLKYLTQVWRELFSWMKFKAHNTKLHVCAEYQIRLIDIWNKFLYFQTQRNQNNTNIRKCDQNVPVVF